MRPELFFKDVGILALTSDASIDFTPLDFNAPLTVDQRAYLKKNGGTDVPQVFWRKQVHGDDILKVQSGMGSLQDSPEADAFITDAPRLPIAIRTADCVPVFIFDPVHQAIGLAHAGWKGTYKMIAAKTVQRMAETYGSKPLDLKVVLGPSIRVCCYQVGEEFRDYFPSHVKDRAGNLYADVVAANKEQLLQAGVRSENIFDSGRCTCCDKNYFSFRREGPKAGRMISLMMLL